MKKINILVLGVGGNVSQGIIKAIYKSKLKCRIVGACISEESLGLYFCESAYISPYANSNEFLLWLINICKKEKIDIVLTGVEEIIIKIAANIKEFKQKTKAFFICTTYDKLKIGQNKLKTNIWLKENGLNYPKFANSKNISAINSLVKEVGFPLIAKPVKGKGSSGILIINNLQELSSVTGVDNYLIQEYLGDDNSEYTVGCYCDKNGKIFDPIIMHRELKYGTTFKAKIINNDIIKKEAMKICEKFKPIGPLNIQLRLNKKGEPVCFELNVRFSGTTPIRAHFGFNDVEAMIKEYVLNEKLPDQFDVKKGIAYRYFNEVYFDDNVQEIIKKHGKTNDIKKYKVSTDNLGP